MYVFVRVKSLVESISMNNHDPKPFQRLITSDLVLTLDARTDLMSLAASTAKLPR